MIKKLALLLNTVVWFFMPNQSQAEIQEINSILEAKDIFNKANKDSLILFDVDYVLTQPNVHSLQMGAIKTYKTIWKNLVDPLSSLEKNFLSTLTVTSNKSMLLESNMITQIGDLQAKGVPVFGLTGILIGPINDINNIEKWRFQTLKSLGINFSNNFFQIQDITFTMLPRYNGQLPRFSNGILFANGDSNQQEKVNVLTAFLDLLKTNFNWEPKEIIMIDDREHNLVAIEKLCHNFLGIKFRGFYYKGAKNYPQKMPTEIEFKNNWQKHLQKYLLKHIKRIA